MSDELKEALKISGEDWLSDHEIVIYNAARHWAISTIECPTCGGSGDSDRQLYRDGVPQFHTDGTELYEPCPNCVRGRTASPEVLERMAQALYATLGEVRARPLFSEQTIYHLAALAAWLAERRTSE
jgi:hypothetical protein